MNEAAHNPWKPSAESGASGPPLRLAVASAVNRPQVLEANLLRSPLIASGRVPLTTQRGYPSAGAAYNPVLAATDADVVVFAHQDIYLPAGWEQRLMGAIGSLERAGKKWGALGVIGLDAAKAVRGCAYCQANGRQFGNNDDPEPCEAISFDEIVLVVNVASGLRFDANLPSFHLYGTDLVLNGQAMGLPSYVINAPVVHNTLPARWLDKGFAAAYHYLRHKWKDRLPLTNLIVPVTASGWALQYKRLKQIKGMLLDRGGPPRRLEDPAAKAAELGYESAGASGSGGKSC